MSWPTAPLGELVDFYSGGTPSRSNPDFWDGDVPWFSAKDMKRYRLADSAQHLSQRVFAASSLRKLQPGTVVMVVRGMILAHTVPIAMLDAEAAINQDLKALIPRTDILPEFLAAMLRAQHSDILARVSTAAHGTKKLDSRVLENIPVPVPSVEEQRRIAAILDHADTLRDGRALALESLNSLRDVVVARAMGNDMRGSIDLGDVAEVQGGLQVTSKRATNPREVPYLRVANVYRGRMDLAEIKSMRVTDKELERVRLQPNDLLLVEGHGNSNEVGRAARWTQCP